MVKTDVDTVDSEIIEARTLIRVPSEAGITQFTSPLVGPNTYREVGRQILGSGLVLPTFGDTVRLTHAAYFPKKDAKQLKDIRDITYNRWQWGYTVNAWTDKGVYSITDDKALGRSMIVDFGKLEDTIRKGKEIARGVVISQDGNVRFADKEYYTLGEHTQESLARDGFVIALTGSQSESQRLAELSSKFSYKPITYGVEVSKGQKPELRVSALGVDVGGLLVDGGWGGYGGCASGVQK